MKHFVAISAVLGLAVGAIAFGDTSSATGQLQSLTLSLIGGGTGEVSVAEIERAYLDVVKRGEKPSAGMYANSDGSVTINQPGFRVGYEVFKIQVSPNQGENDENKDGACAYFGFSRFVQMDSHNAVDRAELDEAMREGENSTHWRKAVPNSVLLKRDGTLRTSGRITIGSRAEVIDRLICRDLIK